MLIQSYLLDSCSIGLIFFKSLVRLSSPTGFWSWPFQLCKSGVAFLVIDFLLIFTVITRHVLEPGANSSSVNLVQPIFLDLSNSNIQVNSLCWPSKSRNLLSIFSLLQEAWFDYPTADDVLQAVQIYPEFIAFLVFSRVCISKLQQLQKIMTFSLELKSSTCLWEMMKELSQPVFKKRSWISRRCNFS